MKKLFLILAISIAGSLASHAQSYYGYRLGNTDYWSGSNGYSGSGYQLGNQYYYQDNYGSGSGYRLGNGYYYNYTPNYGYGR